MSFYSHHAIHDFLKNKDMNEIYVSFAIMAFAESLITIFVPIYLYKLGYMISSIIFYFLLVSFSFVMFSFPGARIVSRLGVKHSIFFSTFFMIAYYLGLRFIGVFPALFFVLPVLLSLRMVFFNLGFHLNYIEHSDKRLRGHELSLIYAVSMTATVIGPFIGAVIIAGYGYSLLFVLGSLLLLVSVMPLFFTKEAYEKIKFDTTGLLDMFSKKDRNLLLSFSGYAVESIIGRVLWPLFLIMLLLSIQTVGLIFSASMILSLIVFYFIAFVTDRFDRREVLKFATVFYFFAWIGRLFADTYLKVLAIDSYKNLSEKVLQIPWSAYSYDVASKRDYFKFIVQREIAFNLTRCIVLPVLMLLFYLDFYPFVISFVLASLFSLLYVFLIRS